MTSAPGFRLISEVFTGSGKALAEVDTRRHEDTGYKMHPAVLDGCVQSIAGAIGANAGSYLPIGAGYFDVSFIHLPERVWAHAAVQDFGDSLTADITVVDDSGQTLARLHDLELRRVTARSFSRLAGKVDESVFFAPVWERSEHSTAATLNTDVCDIAGRVQLQAASTSAQHGMAAYPEVRDHTNHLCATAIVRALAAIGCPLNPGLRFEAGEVAQRCGVLPRHRMLFERLLEILAEDGVLRRDPDGWRCAQLLPAEPADWKALETRHPAFAAETTIAARCAGDLAGVLQGSIDPLDLLFPGGSTETAERLYSESPSARTFNSLLAQVATAAAASADSSRTLRVLEIGGGTGGTSTFVLPLLSAERTRYVFTDISPLFVARAKERFSSFPFVTYSPLDIEQDPLKQGFTEGGFDVIIAANVLHATADLAQTLDHVARLLAPGGVLLLLEITQKERWIDLSFGMTEGWWRFVDRGLRPSYPLLSTDSWKSLLADSGFSTVESIEAGENSLNAILVAKRSLGSTRLNGEWLVKGDSATAPSIVEALAGAGARATLAGPDLDAAIRAKHWDGVVYMAAEKGSPDIRTAEEAICAPLLDIVHAMDGSATKLFVVTTGAQPAGCAAVVNPEQATLWGMARAIASEYAGLKVVCVDLDPAAPDACVAALVDVASATDGEPEIAYRDGSRYVRRVKPARLEPPAERLRLSVDSRGLIDNLRIERAIRKTPGPGQVEIEIEVAAIGFRDVLNVLGMYPGDPGPLGAECAGRVVATGPEVTEFAPGDNVVAIAPGCHDGYVLADAQLVARRPAQLSPETAMTLPVPYLTAIYALEYLGRIGTDDRVLIHSGAGGVGLAAIQVAQRAGAEIFATAGTEEKREFLKSLGVKHVLDSRSTDFPAYIDRATGGRGVDIVLNSLAGESIEASFSSLAPGGRFLEIGKNGIWSREQVEATGRNLSYFVIDWSEELRGNASLIGAMLRRLVDDAAAGLLRPLPKTVFSFSDATGGLSLHGPGAPHGTHPSASGLRRSRSYPAALIS